MPSDTRSTDQRTFSISVEASEGIDEFAKENNMSKSKVVETAVLEFLEATQTDRIESKVDEILEKMGGDCSPSPSSSENRPTHTQTESDGGVSVQSGQSDDPAKITSFDEYEPSLPGDYELPRDTLEDCIDYVENGGAINDDHIDKSLLTSRGFEVRYKVAICAGIIRHDKEEIASESTIKDILEDLLGSRRQANAKFNSVVTHFYDNPTDHEEVDLHTVLNNSPLFCSLDRDDLYALSYNVLEKGYQQLQSEDEE